MEIDVSHSNDAVWSEKGSAIIYILRCKLLAHIHEYVDRYIGFYGSSGHAMWGEVLY